ncbi:hypothetical protein [Microbispora sp. NBRC 16548]|uniref:hypothetical protein n=1 Tax=Microbispora sp. NBRC 16548 TaxID=3030994 RepID=UPI00161F5881|nr:hypothetical protein [Microbispora sp. NBRC 16548]GLX05645.1 hypothetical protein Misp03_25720 [Microbispora sp. NBRC 16548]
MKAVVRFAGTFSVSLLAVATLATAAVAEGGDAWSNSWDGNYRSCVEFPHQAGAGNGPKCPGSEGDPLQIGFPAGR